MKKYLAELIGTCVLVTFGCGTAIVACCDGSVCDSAYVATALAFGLVIVAMAYSIGNISGCHINPAVSTAMLILKKISLKDFACYVVAQLLGATLGCGILAALFGMDCGFGANAIQPSNTVEFTVVSALIAEVVLTFVFVLAIIGVTSKVENNAVAGLVIGLTLTLVHIFGIAITGTSVNPARSLMPAIFAGGEALSQVWIFIVAPLAGAALAAVCYKFLSSEKAA